MADVQSASGRPDAPIVRLQSLENDLSLEFEYDLPYGFLQAKGLPLLEHQAESGAHSACEFGGHRLTIDSGSTCAVINAIYGNDPWHVSFQTNSTPL